MNVSRALGVAFAALLLYASATGPLPAKAEPTGGFAALTGSGGPDPSRESVEVLVHLATARVALEAGNWVIESPFGDLQVAVEPDELFLPGQKKVVTIAPDGSTTETPLDMQFYKGTVVGRPGSEVRLVASPDGIYGKIEDASDFRVSLRALHDPGGEPPGWLLHSVSGRVPTLPATALCASPHFSLYANGPCEVGVPTTCIGSACTTATVGNTATLVLKVRPWADYDYWNKYSDWSSRISAAFYYNEDMWAEELTNTNIQLWAITKAPYNYAMSMTSCGGASDLGLGTFKEWIWGTYNFAGGPNAHALFHSASPPGEGRGGCALPNHLTGGTADKEAVLAVEAEDWYCCSDSYDPDETDHMAVALHHELSHLAGEEVHRGEYNSWCDHNLMQSGIPYWCMYSWRTNETQSKVRAFMQRTIP